MNGTGFIETKNMHGVDGEIVFSDGTSEILEYDTDNPIIKFQTYAENKKIVSVKFPESVKTIEFAAFSYCDSLESITLPGGIESIEGSAFLACPNIASIAVKSSNKCYRSIDGVLFTADEKRLVCYPPKKAGEEYTVPEGVTDIESSAFYGCKSLVAVNIPESVTSIGGSAFEGCTRLKNITVPEGVTVIGGGAFKDCKSIESITVPDGIEVIGSSTFENCKGLLSITIPESVTVIKDRAFAGCGRLSGITVVKEGKKVAPRKDEFREGILKDNKYREGFLVSTTSIGWYAFEDCESLTSVTVPDGAYSIGSHAFKGCKNLKSIIIPKSVNYIGRDIFEGCVSLEDVYYKGSVFRWKGIEKASLYPEAVRLNENETKFATKYYHYSDSKIYSTVRQVWGRWDKFMNRVSEFPLGLQILSVLALAAVCGLVGWGLDLLFGGIKNLISFLIL
jgi:hypothetical protein